MSWPNFAPSFSICSDKVTWKLIRFSSKFSIEFKYYPFPVAILVRISYELFVSDQLVIIVNLLHQAAQQNTTSLLIT